MSVNAILNKMTPQTTHPSETLTHGASFSIRKDTAIIRVSGNCPLCCSWASKKSGEFVKGSKFSPG